MRNSSPSSLIAGWAAAGLLVFGATAEANPFARFFYSIRHPHHQRLASDRHKRVNETAPGASKETASGELGPQNSASCRIARGSTHTGETTE